MPPLPWKSFAAPRSGTQYTALLSYLPLNKWSALPRFMGYTFQIRRQLASSRGLVGYSLDADLPRKEFWTLSVWEDDEALQEFVRRNPHGKVMVDLLPHMGETKFLFFKIDGASVPPNWEDVRRRMGERETTAT